MKPEDVYVESCVNYAMDCVESAFMAFRPLFDAVIRPGDRVVLKPNWIAPHHRYRSEEWESVITHPAVISATLRQVCRRLAGHGEVIITDGPQTDSSFAGIMERMFVKDWQSIADDHGIGLSILDLRDMEWQEEGDVIFNRTRLSGDPIGSVEFDLSEDSNFVGHVPSVRGYYGADYNIEETNAAHSQGVHKYRVSKTIINADVFINLPKLKTHKKAGVTCSLKNLVGINTYKNFLPHHTEGTPAMGGDQFPGDDLKSRSEVLLLRRFKETLLRFDRHGRLFIPIKRLGKVLFGETKHTIRSGNWYGNDTLWRTILDLNALLLYGRPDSTLREADTSNQKRYLSIIDGIVAGEGNGPEAPDPINAGLLIAGLNPLSVDCVAARLMGFDYRKIPSLRQGFATKSFPILDCDYDHISVLGDDSLGFRGFLAEMPEDVGYSFRPHFGWRGHIELEAQNTS